MMIEHLKGGMNLKDKLKKGQAFLGVDGIKYYYLGLDYHDQVLFTTPELWTNIEPEYYAKSKFFIKEVLNEKSDMSENCTWYYQSLNELEDSSMEDKIKRCLDIIKNSNLKDFELRPISIGPLVKGQAYSKDINQYYEVIGFIVDNDIYIDNKKELKQKGFFAIYHSNCDESVPLIFERTLNNENSFDSKKFVASTDDIVDIKEVICDKEKVNDYMNYSLKERISENEERER